MNFGKFKLVRKREKIKVIMLIVSAKLSHPREWLHAVNLFRSHFSLFSFNLSITMKIYEFKTRKASTNFMLYAFSFKRIWKC